MPISRRFIPAANQHLKQQAQAALTEAVRKGILRRPSSCSRCGKPSRVDGHHSDYANALSVVWVCSGCHKHEHFRADVEPTVATNIRLPKSVDRAVEIEAAHRDVSKQQLIEEAIRLYLGMQDAA